MSDFWASGSPSPFFFDCDCTCGLRKMVAPGMNGTRSTVGVNSFGCPLDRLISDSGTVVLLLIVLLRWRCREMHGLWLVWTSYGYWTEWSSMPCTQKTPNVAWL
jgi:hypothetical protein